MNTTESAITKISESLAGLPFDFAFLGGSILSLLVTDSTIDAIRVTKDVDVIVDIKDRWARNSRHTWTRQNWKTR